MYGFGGTDTPGYPTTAPDNDPNHHEKPAGNDRGHRRVDEKTQCNRYVGTNRIAQS